MSSPAPRRPEEPGTRPTPSDPHTGISLNAARSADPDAVRAAVDGVGGLLADVRQRDHLMTRTRRVATLLRILVPRDLRTRYRRSAFDVLWAVISPVVLLLVYGLILTRAFGVTSSCGPYLSSAWVGLVVWTFFATAVGSGVYSLVSASDLLTKVYFPREALPLATVGASFLDLGVGVLTAVVLVLAQGVRPGVTALGVLPALAVLVVWTAVVTVLTATLAVFARDTVHVVQLLLRVGFFATPVMYGADQLPGAFAWSARVNPLAVTIEAVRDSVLCGRWPDGRLLMLHLAAGLVALLGAVLLVRATESRIADVV